MQRQRSLVWIVMVIVGLVGSLGYAASKLKGWVTDVDPVAHTVEVDGQSLSTTGVRITGGTLERGAFVELEKGHLKVKPQHLPVDERLSEFPVKGPGNPGPVGFSHLRHFNALGEKQCKTCHSSEGVLVNRTAGRATTHALREAHAAESLGRFCASCHDGTTRLAEVGMLKGRQDTPIFTAFKTDNPQRCLRCHIPAEHGSSFVMTHGEVVEKRGRQICLACHAQDWTPRERQALAEFLAAEQTLKANPNDAQAALVVGPNNFCVYCHRTDTAWREE